MTIEDKHLKSDFIIIPTGGLVKNRGKATTTTSKNAIITVQR